MIDIKVESNGNLSPNLFEYATSELSQDAFFAYLLKWSDPLYKNTDFLSYQLGLQFVRLLTSSKDLQIYSVKIFKQWEHIDILVEINDDTVIVIEDKTFTTIHGNQLSDYKTAVNNYYGPKSKYFRKNIIFIYISPFNEQQANLINIQSQFNYKVIGREILLSLFNGYRGNNTILNDYKVLLNEFENKTQSFKNIKYLDWCYEAWQGFYMFLNKHIPELRWHYVANPSGGFLCAHWYWSWLDIDKVSLYLQFDQLQLCIKLCCADVPVNKRSEMMWKYNKLILNDNDSEVLKIKKPKRLRSGVYTTIAVIQLSDICGLLDNNGFINLSNIKECLLPYENFIDKFT